MRALSVVARIRRSGVSADCPERLGPSGTLHCMPPHLIALQRIPLHRTAPHHTTELRWFEKTHPAPNMPRDRSRRESFGGHRRTRSHTPKPSCCYRYHFSGSF
ncbi:Inactive Glycosyltransferase 25 Family Member 3 [Manis pentadactyla]|nr:Inactive Glycosyltransferase 25 Family Member 3 [Manis pentadactyla]